MTFIGPTPPKVSVRARPDGVERRTTFCPECGTNLWTRGEKDPVTIDVKTGTLDHPELMEPDLHSYFESRIPWVLLPEGAKTCLGQFDFRKEWPPSSLQRFDAALKRYEDRMKEAGAIASASEEGEVVIWDVGSKDVLQRLDCGGEVVLSVDTHPTEKMIVSAGLDRVVRVWRDDGEKNTAGNNAAARGAGENGDGEGVSGAGREETAYDPETLPPNPFAVE